MKELNLEGAPKIKDHEEVGGIIAASDWLQQYEVHAAVYGWTDQIRYAALSKAFTGCDRAMQWHLRVMLEVTTWREWLRRFRREFQRGPGVQHAARNDWMTLRQKGGETVENFFVRFSKVQRRAANEGGMRRLVMPDHEAALKFVSGLNDGMRAHVPIPLKVETLLAKKAQALQAEQMHRVNVRPSPARAVNVGAVVTKSSGGGSVGKVPVAVTPAPAVGATPALNWEQVCLRCPRSTPMHMRVDCQAPTAFKCYTCGEDGHVSLRCPRTAAERAAMVCSICGVQGHLGKACKSAAADSQQQG